MDKYWLDMYGNPRPEEIPPAFAIDDHIKFLDPKGRERVGLIREIRLSEDETTWEYGVMAQLIEYPHANGWGWIAESAILETFAPERIAHEG